MDKTAFAKGTESQYSEVWESDDDDDEFKQEQTEGPHAMHTPYDSIAARSLTKFVC